MDTDRNLLFAVIALQADVIDREQFVQACSLWASVKAKPIADILLEHHWISNSDRAHIEYLLERKLKRHGGDAKASLVDVVDDRVRRCLAALDDADVQRSIADTPLPRGHVLVSTAAYAPDARNRYSLSRLHASGGIGRVWLAHDGSLGRDVALKELRPERCQDQRLWARFLKEAKITGQLEHPGIVPIYELSERQDDHQPFYTMRFIKGRTLAEAIHAHHQARRAGKTDLLALRDILQAFVGVCNAVAYAHSRGVVHRDLKPQNVVLGDFGEVIVLDWGLAKVLHEEETDAETELPIELAKENHGDRTLPGSRLGTPAYMAPEQAEGRVDRITAQTDVYGLGAILYELLTGQPPFAGSDTDEVLRRVCVEAPVQPRCVVANLPIALESICIKALAKTPAQRYASAKELAADVQRWLADEPVAAHRESFWQRTRRWMRRHHTAVIGGMTAAAAALLVLGATTILLTNAYANERDAKIRSQENFELAREAVEKYLTSVSDDPDLKNADFHPLRKRLLESALPFYQRLVEQPGPTSALQARRAQAFEKLGVIQRMTGNPTLALDHFRQMQTILEDVVKREPSNRRYQSYLGASLGLQGVCYEAAGNDTEAERAYRQAIVFFAALCQERDTTVDCRSHLSANQNNLALLLHGLGRFNEAEEFHLAALKNRQQLVADFPDVAVDREDLATSHNNLGTLLQRTGRMARAEESLRDALRLRWELLASHPRVPRYRELVAATLHNLASLLVSTGRVTDALPIHQEAIDLLLKLVTDFRRIPHYRASLAEAYHGLGLAHNHLDQNTEAETAFQSSRKHYQALVDETQDVAEHRQGLAVVLYNLANVYRRTERLPLAEAGYREVLPLQERLVKDDAAKPDYRAELARTRIALATLCAIRNQFEEADALFEAGLAEHRHLAKAYPNVPEYQSECGTAILNWGVFADKRKQWPESQRRMKEALQYQQAALKANPRNQEYQQLYRQNALFLADVQLQLKDGVAVAATLAAAEAELAREPANAVQAARFLARSLAFMPGDQRDAPQLAMRLLRQAFEKGYFNNTANVQVLKTSKDLEPLRSLEEYKKLVVDAEKTLR